MRFIRFLVEVTARQFWFEINWPLYIQKVSRLYVLKNATLNSKVIIRRQLEAVDHPATEGGNLSTHKHLFKDSAATKQ